MKLIVEQKNGCVYVYRESEKHHRAVEPQRENETPKLDLKLLDNGCNISVMGDCHFVFDLKR